MKKIFKYGCLSCLAIFVLAVFSVVWVWQAMTTVPRESKERQVSIAKEVFEDDLGLEVISIEADNKIWSEAGHFNVTVTLKDGPSWIWTIFKKDPLHLSLFNHWV